MKNSIKTVWIYARSCDRRPDVLPPLMREAKRRNYRVAGISIDPYRRYPGHGLKMAMNAIKSGYAGAILTPYLSAISSNPKVIRKVLTSLQDSGAVIITTESDICLSLLSSVSKTTLSSGLSNMIPLFHGGYTYEYSRYTPQ